MKYPIGPAYRMLLLTGLRLNECAKISWPEVHGDHVIIPAERMKGKNGRAREHLVPLSSTALEVLASLPRYRGGRYLFSFSAGDRPVAMASPAKRDLDRRMLRTLKAMACRRGEDHHPVTLPNWTNHDLRRVVRSGLSTPRPAQRRGSRAAHKPSISSASTTRTNIWTKRGRWRRARGSSPSSNRCPPPPRPPVVKPPGGSDDQRPRLHPLLADFTYTDEQWDQIRPSCAIAWPRCRPDRASGHGTPSRSNEMQSRCGTLRLRRVVIFGSARKPDAGHKAKPATDRVADRATPWR